MPTLQHGARHFLNLGAGQMLTVTCDAVSSAVVRSYPIAPGGESTGQSAVAASATYTRGPFMSATRWAVEAAGSGVSYAIAGSADADATVDAGGNVAANGSPVSGAGLSTVAILGDSITNATATISASRIDYNVLGYYTYLKSLLQGRLTLVGEYGYSGYKIAELTQYIPTLLAQRPSCVIYLAGTNDVYWEDPIATVIAADTANMTALLAGAQCLVVLGVPPRSDAVGVPAKLLYSKQLDDNKRTFCAANPRAIYVDLKQVLADPSTGDWVSGYANVDGVHPVAAGSLRIARAASVPLESRAVIESPLVVGYRDTGNLIFNGALVGSNASGTNGYQNTTGMTGSGPDGWRAQISGGSIAGVVSSVSRPTTDLRAGNCAQIAVTGDSTGANGAQLQYRTLSASWAASTSYTRGAAVRPTTPNGYRYVVVSGNATTGSSEPTWPTTLGSTVVDNAVTWMCCLDFQVGQYVQAAIEVEPSSFNGNFDLTLAVQALNESSTVLFTAGDMLSAADVSTQPSFGSAYQPRVRLITLPMLIPSGTTRLYTTVGVRAPTGVTGNLKIQAARLDVVPTSVYQAT